MSRFVLPSSRPRRRPQELSYSADERPATPTLLALGFQHAAMALGLSAYVLVAAKGAGLNIDDTRSLLAVSIIGMAFATALQAWGGRLGVGALIVHIPSPFVLPLAIPILAGAGVGGMVVITLVSGVVALVVSRFANHLRSLFPPIVTGLVVLMGGLSMVKAAFVHTMGVDQNLTIDGDSVAISVVTFGLIVALSIWGGRRAKLFALLLGIGAGVIVSLMLGRLTGGEALLTVPAVAVPTPIAPVFDVPLGAIIGVAFIAVLAQIDSIGSFILMDKMDDADWRRPDMRQAARGIQANGLSDVLCGLIGSMTNGSSSANIGLCHASRATTRYAGLATAGILLIIAFLPQVTLALTLIPTPVIGAIEFYAAAFLIASGIDLVASRQLDTRGVFIIGISLVVGVALMMMPGVADGVPALLHPLVGSGFIMTGVLAIVLNLLFRLGIRKTQVQEIDTDGPATTVQVTDFIERVGGAWAARRDVVRRAALAAVEVVEAIDLDGDGRRVTAVIGSFDELNLNIELRHTGAPLPLEPAATMDLSSLLDGEDDKAIDVAIANMSQVLIQRLADRMKCGIDPAAHTAFLRLHFNH